MLDHQPAPEQNKKTDPNIWRWAAGICTIILLILAACIAWYQLSLQPADPDSKQSIRFIVKKGQGNTQIAKNLEKSKIIRSSTAMILYLKLARKPANLQTGTYVISPSYSVPEVVSHLEKGNTDVFNVRISPGRTLNEIKKDLSQYGYTSEEVDAALNAKYDSALLADKPISADLEGYIFPETFEMSASSELKSLFQRSIDTLYNRLQEDGLIEKFQARGLSIYQALTLASIVQQEASDPQDQAQIAQVFYKRLSIGMKLESDPTFVYAAKKLGVEPRVTIDSPYNTRKNGGLPPGPISNMNYSALQSIAYPSSGEYLYFVAGDDGKTYFSMTLQEHEGNVEKHCKKLCQLF